MKYTKIPDSYKEQYETYFDLDKLAVKYNHDKVGFRMEYVRDHPIPFMYWMIGLKLRIYQAYAIDQFMKHKNTAICWGRQLGKSVSLASYVFWSMFFNKYPSGFDNSTRIIYISHTEDGAKKIISEVNKFIEMGDERYNKVTSGKVPNFFSRLMKGNNNAFEITFKNNGVSCFLKSFAPTQKIVGNTGSILIIDESARLRLQDVSEDTFFREWAEPTISSYPHAKKIYSSTPEGMTGKFYYWFDPDDIYTEHEFERIWFPYTIRAEPDYLENMEKVKKEYERDGKVKEFEQEFMAMFVSSEGRYFDPEKHISKFVDKEMCQIANYYSDCYLGIDFGGQRTSHTVLTIVAEEPNNDPLNPKKIIKRLWHKVYPIKEDNDLIPDIKNLKTRFALKGINIDSQGGAYIVPEIKKLGLPVTEMVFRKEKDSKYDMFRVKMFRGEIKTYDDAYLLREMYALNNEIKAPNGYTDDAIDSLVISCYHYLVSKQKYVFYSLWGNEKKGRTREIANETEEILSSRY